MVLLTTVKEFMKTVCKQIVSTLTKRKKNMSSKNPEDWIYDIIPEEQIAEMEYKASRLENNMDKGVSIVMSSSHESALNLIRAYRKSQKKHDLEAWIYVMEFLATLMRIIEEHLEDEGINTDE